MRGGNYLKLSSDLWDPFNIPFQLWESTGERGYQWNATLFGDTIPIRASPPRPPGQEYITATNYWSMKRYSSSNCHSLIAVGFPILFFFLWGDPYKRGFFCNDESLRHPFHDSTVRNWMLYIVGLILPIGTVSFKCDFPGIPCRIDATHSFPPLDEISGWH